MDGGCPFPVSSNRASGVDRLQVIVSKVLNKCSNSPNRNRVILNKVVTSGHAAKIFSRRSCLIPLSHFISHTSPSNPRSADTRHHSSLEAHQMHEDIEKIIIITLQSPSLLTGHVTRHPCTISVISQPLGFMSLPFTWNHTDRWGASGHICERCD
jgi:hypothetical protein